MKLKRFQGLKINGYLDIEIPSFEMLTFVTGINGSGKTTVLNSIIALLLPRIDFLATHEFELIEIEFNDGNRDVQLSAKREGKDTILLCSAIEDSLKIIPFAPDPDLPAYRIEEYETDYYRDFFSSHIETKMLAFLLDLPTPMYLGLDRRMIGSEDMSRYNRRPPSNSRRPVRRNVFSASLRESLGEALFFTERRYRDANLSKSRFDEEFQKEMILDLIDLPPISFSREFRQPSSADLRRLNSAKENLSRLPQLIRIPESDVMDKLNPLFLFLDERASILHRSRRNNKTPISPDSPEFSALGDWQFNKTHIDKVNNLSEIISSYNAKVDAEFSDIEAFLKSINGFMADSGKTIVFDKGGSLRFSMGDKGDGRSLSTMSSGEIQLFVILAHLHFNPEASNAGIFIIDEPELSLHVQWQEKFVDEIMRAAPNLQYILATHSPSIILEKTDNCFDISIK